MPLSLIARNLMTTRPDLTLYITYKNYSSWSLRAWLLMQALEIPFTEKLLEMTDDGHVPGMVGISPTAKVPCLVDHGMGGLTVWETVAIAEYLDELHPDLGVWPEHVADRATARALVAEMHGGFSALRGECPMNLRRAPAPLAVSDDVRRDVARAEAIFDSCLTSTKSQSDGLFLMGRFSAVDAFYAPLATRLVTYQLSDHPAVAAFMAALESLPAWQEWHAAAMREMAIIAADEVD